MWATDPMPAAAARLDALHERVAREEAYADRAQHMSPRAPSDQPSARPSASAPTTIGAITAKWSRSSRIAIQYRPEIRPNR